MKCLTILSLFFFFTSFSQERNISFLNFKSEKNIQQKAKKALILWNEYLRSNLDSLKILGDELLIDAYEKNNLFAIAVGKRALGSYYIRNGKSEKGIAALKEARFYFEKIEDFELLTETLSEIGNAYNLDGEPKNAIEWYNKSLVAGKNSTDPTSSFLAEINIAKSYTDLNELEKAEEIIHHYISQTQKYNRKESEANAWTRLGIIAQMKGQSELAQKYYLKSKDLNLKAGSKIQASHGYNNLAIVCFELGNLDGALSFFKKALRLRLECNNWKAITESYFNIGELYLEQKEFSKALENYTLSLNIASKKGLLVEKLDAMYAIIQVYKTKKDFIKAYQLMEEYSELKSQLQEKDKLEAIQSSEMDMILMEKEQKRNQIVRENELFEKINYQKLNMKLLIGGISLMCLLLVFYFFFKNKMSFKKNG